MPQGLTFPDFGAAYDQQKMTALVRALEQRLNPSSKKLLVPQASTTATVNFAQDTDVLLVGYTATGAVTVNLPLVGAMVGRLICVKDSGGNADPNNITVDANGSETIDGAATKLIATDGGVLWLYSDGAAWHSI